MGKAPPCEAEVMTFEQACEAYHRAPFDSLAEWIAYQAMLAARVAQDQTENQDEKEDA